MKRWRACSKRQSVRCQSVCAPTLPTYCPSCVAAAAIPDLLTDQTSAHDPWVVMCGGFDLAAAALKSQSRMPTTGVVFDGEPAGRVGQFLPVGTYFLIMVNNVRVPAAASRYGLRTDFPLASLFAAMPGFVPAYIRPLFCEGKGPFCWAALSEIRQTLNAPTPPCWK